jgi:transmembrane sensor
MSEHIDWEQLARYVSGESSAAEAAEIDRLASGDETRRRLIESIERRWRASASVEVFDVDRAWQRFSSQLHAPGENATRVIPMRGRAAVWSRWALPIAASVLITLGLAGLWRYRESQGMSRTTRSAVAEARTGIGEHKLVDLPDGSSAVLGARSALRMESQSGASARVVHLEGEAIFSVRHDVSRPFRVVAGGVITEDVGTEFSVRAYPGEASVRVAVREGAVSVTRASSPGTPPVLLGRSDVAHVDADREPLVTSGVAVDRLFAWRDGELVFDDIPLSEVATELSRWYDVEVRFADPSLATRHLTASFKSEPIEEVLRVIALTLEVRFEQHGRLVTVHSAPRTTSGDTTPRRSADVAVRSGV